MSPWIVDRERTECHGSLVRFEVNPSRPSDGMKSVQRVGNTVLAEHLLGISLPGDETQSPSECYARGDDLIALYPQTPNRKVSPELYWRSCSLVSNGQGIELIVSMQTSSLNTLSSIVVTSEVPTDEVWSITADGPEQLSKSPIREGLELQHALLLFRQKKQQLSYAEIVYPSDFDRLCLTPSTTKPGHVSVTHSLRVDHLEKGVIRRARILGHYVRRDDDLELATMSQQIFEASVPPLSS